MDTYINDNKNRTLLHLSTFDKENEKITKIFSSKKSSVMTPATENMKSIIMSSQLRTQVPTVMIVSNNNRKGFEMDPSRGDSFH